MDRGKVLLLRLQELQESLDPTAQMLYLFGSYALQVRDIVKITALGLFG